MLRKKPVKIVYIYLVSILLYMPALYSQDVIYSRAAGETPSCYNPAARLSTASTQFSLYNKSLLLRSGEYLTANTLYALLPQEQLRSAFGLMLDAEQLPDIGRQTIALSYSYQVQLGENYLSFGAEEETKREGIDFSGLDIKDSDDPLLSEKSTYMFGFNVGCYFESPFVSFGVTVKNLVGIMTDAVRENYTRVYMAHIKYLHEINSRQKISLSAYGAKYGSNPVYADFVLGYTKQNSLFGGIGMNSELSPSLHCRYNFSDLLKMRHSLWLRYAFDFSTAAQSYSAVRHELSLQLLLRQLPDPAKIRKQGSSVSPVNF